MKTIRWFEVNVPLRTREFSKKLLEYPFSKDSGEGFLVKKVSSSEIIGQYIQSKTFIKEVKTPFGETNTISGVDYNTIDFKFTISEKSLLEVYSKPRSLLPFFNELSRILGFGFFIANININLSDFIPLLESEFGKIVITKMEISDLNVDNIALGQLILTSDRDVRESLESYIFLNKDYKVKSIKAHLPHSNIYQGSFEINKNSRLELSHMPNQAFLNEYLPLFLRSISD